MAKKFNRKQQEIRKFERKTDRPARIVPEAVLPSYVENVLLRTEKDLLALGQANLKMFKKYWRRKERDLGRRIDELSEVIKALESVATPEVLGASDDAVTRKAAEALAAKYERPEFPEVALMKNAIDGKYHPEPQDEASRSRRPGKTTFNYCGWCKYAHNSIRRCNYNIASQCKLLWPGMVMHDFNTSCMVLNQSALGISATAEYLKMEKNGIANEKSNVVAKLHYLSWLEKQAAKDLVLAKLPPLPICREDVPYEVGQEVVCYLPQWEGIWPEWQRMFVVGTVMDTPERLNGWVTVKFLQQVSRSESTRGVLGGYGVNLYVHGSFVMTPEEFEILRWNPEYREVWLRSCVSPGEDDQAVRDEIVDFRQAGPLNTK